MIHRKKLALAIAVVMVASVVAATDAFAQARIGGWIVSVTNGRGRRPVKTAILLADDGASLIAACDAAGVDLVVSYLDALPKEPEAQVIWRLDGGAAHRQAWQEGSDQSSLSPGGSDADAAVLRQFARARTLTISAAGRRSTFDLTGVRQIVNLIGSCPTAAAAMSAPAGSSASPSAPAASEPKTP